MISLYLVRHGECEGGHSYIGGGSDFPLNGIGRKQIKQLSITLKNIFSEIEIDALYSSTMIRAKETAQIIGKSTGIPVQTIPGIEELDFGKWEGLTFNELEKKYTTEFQSWLDNPAHISPPEGESLADLKRRVLINTEFLTGKINDEKNWNIILVSHRGPLTVLLLHYLHLGFEYYWNFNINRGSISKLNLYPRFSEIDYLNLTAVP
ncbi:MAG: histidine phosphatase family protein [Spirochaetaceae bacterium]|jgi:alpha-ribazole phosphatase|nr:histidine phosphatase family protein [Spirochaetaceae bacterium]